jgi:hypothetical protein
MSETPIQTFCKGDDIDLVAQLNKLTEEIYKLRRAAHFLSRVAERNHKAIYHPESLSLGDKINVDEMLGVCSL